MNIDWVDMKKPKMRIGTKNHLLQTLAGDSDFRKLSILLIITWFPFPIWFSLSRAPQGLPPAMVSPSSQKARNFTICYHLSYVGYVGFCWIYKLIVHSPYIFPHLIHIYIYFATSGPSNCLSPPFFYLTPQVWRASASSTTLWSLRWDGWFSTSSPSAWAKLILAKTASF